MSPLAHEIAGLKSALHLEILEFLVGPVAGTNKKGCRLPTAA
jgi:hypothetical protein